MVGQLRRIFAAASVPDEVRMALNDRLSDLEIPGKPTPPENWHITLRFLGFVDDVTYERFLGALSQADLGDPFRVSLAGIAAFPRPGRAAVLWVGIDRGVEELTELASLCEQAAREAGLDAEDRPFHPHLTLSRIRPPENVEEMVAGLEPTNLSWRCDSIVAYQSHPGRGGVRYEPLETIPLIG